MKKQTKKKQDSRQWEEEFRTTDDHKALLSEYLKNAGAFVPVRKAFVKLWGLPCAMVLGDLLGWEGYLRKTHAIREDQIQFYRHLSDQSEETGLTRHILRKATEQLMSMRLLDYSIHEETHFRYFKLNHRRILWWAIRYEAGYRSKEKVASKDAKQAEGHQNFNEVRSKKVVKILTRGHQNFNDIFNEIKERDINCLSDSIRVSDETQSLNRTSHTSMKDRTLQKIQAKSSTKKPSTEVLPLPPIEQMPEALQIWQNLPHVQRFRTRRVYDRCVKLIGALQQGRFPTQLSDLKKEDVERYNITAGVLTRKWTGSELAEIIDKRFRLMAENTAYWPGNKEESFIKGLSFESFVFSPHNGRSCLLQLRQRRPEPMKERIAASGRKEKVFDEGEGFYYSTTPWSTAGD